MLCVMVLTFVSIDLTSNIKYLLVSLHFVKIVQQKQIHSVLKNSNFLTIDDVTFDTRNRVIGSNDCERTVTLSVRESIKCIN